MQRYLPARATIVAAGLVMAALLPVAACDSSATGSALGGSGANGAGSDCVPTTCAAQGASCGTISDGCGGTLDCGTCAGTSSGGGSGGTSGGSGGGSGASSGPPTLPQGLFDPTRVTQWNPGILKDTQLNLPLGSDGLPVRKTICSQPAPGADLNAAIAACPEGQVVQLAAGTYTVPSTVTLTKGVVLRGAGSQGANATVIVKQGGGTVLSIGTGQDQACYSGGYGSPYPLTQDAVKETTTVYVGSNAANFAAGDLALIDQNDDSTVQEGDCSYLKRVDMRSVTERVEVASVDASAGTITLAYPLHWTFKAGSTYSAQIAKVTMPVVRWAGIESVYIQGGSNTGYNGQMAGGIDMINAAYSWVKDVQTDGTIGGMHITMTGTVHSVIRDSDFHNSANYGFGADCYGIVVRCGAADNLVENNITRFMNKPMIFDVSGGGNVVAYNYADNSWATPAQWQELALDEHCAFPHMELLEGNYAPHMGASVTHGNAGYFTYYRNYASSQFTAPAVVGSSGPQTGNIAAIEWDQGDIGLNAVANVLGSSQATDLGTAPLSSQYIGTYAASGAIVEVGGMSDVSYTSLFLHGNFDTVNNKVMWDPNVSVKTLPPSLYRSAKPGWWPSGTPWPWAGSDLSPMVGQLPAKARSDTLGH